MVVQFCICCPCSVLFVHTRIFEIRLRNVAFATTERYSNEFTQKSCLTGFRLSRFSTKVEFRSRLPTPSAERRVRNIRVESSVSGDHGP